MPPNSSQLLVITACSFLLRTCLKHPPLVAAKTVETEPWVPNAWRDCGQQEGSGLQLMLFRSAHMGAHSWGQTLLSSLGQPWNTQLRSSALDNLLPHWSWQCGCDHGGTLCFREWDCTSSLAVLHSGYQVPQFPWDSSHCKTWSLRPLLCGCLLALVQYPNSQILQGESALGTVECRRGYERISHNQCYCFSMKRNSRRFIPSAGFIFCQQQPMQSLNPTWHSEFFVLETACVIVPEVGLGVHHEHLKLLL